MMSEDYDSLTFHEGLCQETIQLVDLRSLGFIRRAGQYGDELAKGCYQHMLCYLDGPSGVGVLIHTPRGSFRVLHASLAPAAGCESGNYNNVNRGSLLFSTITQPQGSFHIFLGKTGPHFHWGSNCGNDVLMCESTGGSMYQLWSCVVVPESEYFRFLEPPLGFQYSPGSLPPARRMLESVPRELKALNEYPSQKGLKATYTWIGICELLIYIKSLKKTNPLSTAAPATSPLPFDPIAKFIMFADVLTGVVSPGGVDCVTKTHIPIRAHFDGGLHPGQWRVGGEASFGWGGACQMCTNHPAPQSSMQVIIPFDVMCYRPSVPVELLQQLKSPPLESLPPPRRILCFLPEEDEGCRVSFPGLFLSLAVLTRSLFRTATASLPSSPLPVATKSGRGNTAATTTHCNTTSRDQYTVLAVEGLGRSLGRLTGGGDCCCTFGDEGSGLQVNAETYFQLYLCDIVPQKDLKMYKLHQKHHKATKKAAAHHFDDFDYVWVSATSLLAVAGELFKKSAHITETTASADSLPFDPIAKFIMFADVLTGVVSPGGVDCVTKTHIPIRAHFDGGLHPGQWRVGGEASFGWGGACQMCTTTPSSDPSDVRIFTPFDVLCYRPLLPVDI